MDPLSIIIRQRGLCDFFNKQIIYTGLGQMLSKGQPTQRKASCSLWVGTRLRICQVSNGSPKTNAQLRKAIWARRCAERRNSVSKAALDLALGFYRAVGGFRCRHAFWCMDKHPSSSMRVRLALHQRWDRNIGGGSTNPHPPFTLNISPLTGHMGV